MLCGWNWNHMQAAMHGRGRGRRQAGRAQHNSQNTCETAQKRQKVESARRGGREEVTSACTGAHALARRERARDKDRAYIAAARCSARHARAIASRQALLYMQPAKVPRGWQGLPAPGTVCQLLLLLSLMVGCPASCGDMLLDGGNPSLLMPGLLGMECSADAVSPASHHADRPA